MLQRYLEQHEAIKTTLCLLDRSDLIIPTPHNSALEEAVKILGPFENVTRELSSDKYTSVSKIVPISQCLQRLVSNEMTTRPLAVYLVTEMKGRFLGMEANKILSLSTLLDPSLRIFVSEADVNHYDSTTPESTSSSSQTTSSTSSTASLWQLFDEQVTQTRAATQNLGVSSLKCSSSLNHLSFQGQSVHSSGGKTTPGCIQN